MMINFLDRYFEVKPNTLLSNKRHILDRYVSLVGTPFTCRLGVKQGLDKREKSSSN
jgi:hypothetical protein